MAPRTPPTMAPASQWGGKSKRGMGVENDHSPVDGVEPPCCVGTDVPLPVVGVEKGEESVD